MISNKKCSTEDFILKSKNIFGDLYDYSKVNYFGNKVKVELICKEHGCFFTRPDYHLSRKRGCSKCGRISIGKRNRNKNWLSDFIMTHGDKYDYSSVEYKDSKTKVEIICKKHGSFFMKPNAHVSQKQGCRKCSIKYNNTDSFIESSILIFNEIYDYSKVDYIDSHTKVEVICRQHGSFFIRPSDHINQKQGCMKCGKTSMANKHRKKLDALINEFKSINGDFYDYSLVSYLNNQTKVKIICREHGVFEQSPKSHLKGDGCVKCSCSKGERKIISHFEKNNIKYEHRFTFDNCRYINPLQFDFYLKEYNLCIEYDGEQHSKMVNFFGGNKNFLKQKIRDSIKNNYCLNKNIKLLRINFDEFEDIEKILNEKIK